MTLQLRSAVEADLAGIVRIWLLAEGETITGNEQIPVGLRHIMGTGMVVVAERDEMLAGFAASFVRGDVTFLAQLFIDPRQQSAGIGQWLLRASMPDDGTVRATISSPDPRAVSLYVRHGMVPAWPAFDLRAEVADLRDLPDSMARLMPANPGDPDLVRMDAAVNGRERPEDHRHWMEQRGGVPFWFERGGARVGYGYVQVGSNGSDAGLRGGTVRIGPVGVEDPAAAYDCVLAAVSFAREHGGRLEILMPGPHPVLGTLLDAGFKIQDIETFLATSRPPFVDGALYVPSGGGLF